MRLRHVVGSSISVFAITARALDVHPPNLIISSHNSRPENEASAASFPLPAQGFFDDDIASPEDWTTYTLKGGALMCGLEGTDQEAGELLNDPRDPPSAESQWKGDLKQEMQDWYWHDVHPATYTCKLTDHWNIGFAMRSLGLNGKPKAEGGDNACYRVEHWDPDKQENGQQIPAINQWYKVGNDEKEYRSTQAHYEFGINTIGGAIFCFYLESPVSSASTLWYSNRRAASKSELPGLRALSDILWGFWNRQNADPKNIRFFFMMGISNDMTNQLIASSLHKENAELSEWPGTKIPTSTDSGHALLGSPNGAAFAYFLMQHKSILGTKVITHITIFKPETDDDIGFVDANLAFHVEDMSDGRGGIVGGGTA